MRNQYTANAVECDGDDCGYIGTCLIIADGCYCPDCSPLIQEQLLAEHDAAFGEDADDFGPEPTDDDFDELDDEYEFADDMDYSDYPYFYLEDERDFGMDG